jgi:DNA ligase (NAD+)
MMFHEGKFRVFTDDDNGPIVYLKTDREIYDKTIIAAIKHVREFIEKNVPYHCDGIVVRWMDENAIKTLGRDEKNYVNKFEIAYKFPRANNYTKIVDIIQDIGLMGKASFTALFEPIVMNGKIITHASLGSYDRAKGLNLAKGDTVNIQYEIVPYLCMDEYCESHRSKNEPIELMTECPYCGHPLELNPELSCTNLECKSRVQGKLYTFCIRMNIEGIGPALIEDLYHNGLVQSVPDFFKLKEYMEPFCKIDGLGRKTWKKLVDQFDKLKASESDVLASLAIHNIGPANAKKITAIYHLDDLLEMSDRPEQFIEDLVARGISRKMSENVLKGVKENSVTLATLLKNVKIIKEKQNVSKINNIVFTGFRNNAFKSYLENDMNIHVGDNVTKNTVLVVAEDPNGVSGKLTKARSLNIPIISAVEAYDKFNFKI